METIQVDAPVNDWVSVCERIRSCSQASPNAIAIRAGDSNISYSELDQRASEIANYLIQQRVSPDSTIAICMQRSPDWIIAALAILRIGAAYVPLDPAWPESRIRYAVKDSGAVALVADAKLLKQIGPSVLGLDPSRDKSAIQAAPTAAPHKSEPESLAYLIYTSGSTGSPKGVEITQSNLTNLIDWHIDTFGLTQDDRTGHIAGLGFDAAVWEIWPTLAAGACLCLADDSIRLSPSLIQDWIVRENISVSFAPTVHTADLIQMSWPAATRLRTLLTGGDTLPHGPDASLPFSVVNNYGPTECTVVSTSGIVAPGRSGLPTIGFPITGATAYLLDPQGQPVPDGQAGELFIGGAGVGRGYRNLPAMTTNSFLPDPFAGRPGARMYRTGDAGIRRPNGEIEFHGRLDRQVKIRGQRIELDEIGVTLNQHPAVKFAVVTAEKSANTQVQLIAYVLVNDGCPLPTLSELQKFLLGHLPTYMVPGVFLQIRQIPLSHNGKLDLAKLHDEIIGPLASGQDSKAPASEIEAKVLAVVRESLQSTTLEPQDNFFLAGGHSLLGMQLITRIRSAFGVDLSLRQLFDAPTSEDLALIVEMDLAQKHLIKIWKDLLGDQKITVDSSFQELGGDEGMIEKLQQRISDEFGRNFSAVDILKNETIGKLAAMLYGTSQEDQVMPKGIAVIQPDGIETGIFWMHYPCLTLAKALGQHRPFFCLMVTEEDLIILGNSPSLQQVAQLLMPKILMAQPQGPYILGGFCLGGILSYEIACQMQAAGHEVSIVLLDTPSPEYYRPAQITSLVKRPAYVGRRLKQLGVRRTASRLLDRLGRHIQNKEPLDQIGSIDVRAQELLETAAASYQPSFFDGKAIFIMASELPPDSPPHDHFLRWWSSVIKQEIQSQFVPGQHLDLVRAPAVYNVAEAVSLRLSTQQTFV
jgi:amino acid adenylation domain-containing protein